MNSPWLLFWWDIPCICSGHSCVLLPLYYTDTPVLRPTVGWTQISQRICVSNVLVDTRLIRYMICFLFRLDNSHIYVTSSFKSNDKQHKVGTVPENTWVFVWWWASAGQHWQLIRLIPDFYQGICLFVCNLYLISETTQMKKISVYPYCLLPTDRLIDWLIDWLIDRLND